MSAASASAPKSAASGATSAAAAPNVLTSRVPDATGAVASAVGNAGAVGNAAPKALTSRVPDTASASATPIEVSSLMESLRGSARAGSTDSLDAYNSAVASALNSLSSKQTITTPMIVAIVFGVLGGVIIIGLALWFLCRRRHKRMARRRPSYASEELDEPPTKAELEAFSREESPQREGPIRTALDFSQAPVERTSEPRPPPSGRQHSQHRTSQQQARRVVQEEDAESFVEYLPPQYRAWQAAGQTGIDFSRPPDTWDADHRLSTSSRLQVNDTVTGPEQTPASRDEPVVIAPLKRELMRQFGRTVPQRVTCSGSASDLWPEYKRRFT